MCFEWSQRNKIEGKLNGSSTYVSERKRVPWRGMIALFRTEQYRMPIEGTMNNEEV
jgi:hypothetical protein